MSLILSQRVVPCLPSVLTVLLAALLATAQTHGRPWDTSVHHEGIVHFLFKDEWRVERFDLSSGGWLPSIYTPWRIDQMSASADSVVLARRTITPEGRSQNEFYHVAADSAQLQGIPVPHSFPFYFGIQHADHLLAARSVGDWTLMIANMETGEITDRYELGGQNAEPNSEDSAGAFVLVFFSGLTRVAYDAGGRGLFDRSMPDIHAMFITSSDDRLRKSFSADGKRFLDTSGNVIETESMRLLWAAETDFTGGGFLEDGSIYYTRGFREGAFGSPLRPWYSEFVVLSPEFDEITRLPLGEGSPRFPAVHGDTLFLFEPDGLNFHGVVYDTLSLKALLEGAEPKVSFTDPAFRASLVDAHADSEGNLWILVRHTPPSELNPVHEILRWSPIESGYTHFLRLPPSLSARIAWDNTHERLIVSADRRLYSLSLEDASLNFQALPGMPSAGQWAIGDCMIAFDSGRQILLYGLNAEPLGVFAHYLDLWRPPSGIYWDAPNRRWIAGERTALYVVEENSDGTWRGERLETQRLPGLHPPIS